ncbi:lantibiotic dehydratase [Chitinophaga sp. 22321]|uniref:Lantibiotic dehydratase n=1 Tax=Chitinophaga hostae TaxID=2831022 RepID=A0ABS5IXJ8_9BACT|nr:lantibiotic dehydratase [Chitinophaga hostae]MBS0027595.1 lantibiotic dehydratase [Chitinophaga hostae]
MSELKSCGFYLLRMPLLSCEEVLQLHRTIYHDPSHFIPAIREAYARPLLQEAVFLASPALYIEMIKWLDQPGTGLKLPLALYRYLLRMSTRCTPYGLFAGCITGLIQPGGSQLEAPPPHSRHKAVRLDMAYLSELISELVQRPELRGQLRFYPNSSLYNSGLSYRYFEYQLRDKKRHYFLSSFTQNDYIRALLTAATPGADIAQLVTELGKLDVAANEAQAFIETLIANQILVPGMAPEISSQDSLSALIRELEACQPAPACLQVLQQIRQLLQLQTDGVQRYLDIKALLTEHFPGIATKDPVQVDLFFQPATANLSQQVISGLLERLQRLAILGTQGEPADLKAFKQQFLQQYDQREIPLMMALDSESGIGYGIVSGDHSSYTPLIDDLVMPVGRKKETINWNAQTKFVWQQFLLAQQSGAVLIEITDDQLDGLTAETDAPVLPPFLSLLGSFLAKDTAALDNGDFRFLLKAFNGPNVLALLGRFAAGNEALEQQLREFARMEQSMEKDSIIAEVVHLPEGRTGNVLLRPQLYDYEIPFLGKSSVPGDFQILVSDLYVSVRNDRIVLRSAKLNKEVVPRLSSAHNFNRGLSAYKFLCDLQQQQSLSVHWNWGHLTAEPFLPRVVYREIILQRARWFITRQVYESMLVNHAPEAVVLLLKEKYRIPARVLLSEGDNELLIDFTSVYACTLLADKLKKGDVVLYEQLFNEHTRLLANETGFFCNEVVIPVCNTSYRKRAETTGQKSGLTGEGNGLAAITGTPLRRSFPPGSEWLYVKIYCGPKWIDKLLLKEIQPLVHYLQDQQLVDRWFFIRFHDPDHHLRIRLHLPRYQNDTGAVIRLINKAIAPYLENDIVQKIQLDTYVRELERYGAATMELSESFFFHDSVAVIGLLGAISGAETTERWLLAMKGADGLLEDFGCTPEMKLQLLQQLQQQFFSEHGGDAALLFQLNNKYRKHTALIAATMRDNLDEYTFPTAVKEVFAVKGAANRRLFAQLAMVRPSAAAELLPHYLHMFLNRMFTANARLQELVVYHYLMKYYASQVARTAGRPN